MTRVSYARAVKLFKWLSSLVRCQKVKGKPLKSVRDLNYALRDRRGKTVGAEKRERKRAEAENSLNYLRRGIRQYAYAYGAYVEDFRCTDPEKTENERREITPPKFGQSKQIKHK